MRIINSDAALQAHPEFLNEQIDDHDKAIYAKGWNDCNKEYYNSIAELPVASMACTGLSTRLRRAFEADELVNQRLLLDAADAIEEVVAVVRSVVHCKDCKWCHAGYCEKYDDLIPWGCANKPWEDWFCADGKRRNAIKEAQDAD